MNDIQLIVFDADDTLWRELDYFVDYKRRFTELLASYCPPDEAMRRHTAAQKRNIPYYGFGIISCVLSMMEVAAEVCPGSVPSEILLALSGFIKEHATKDIVILGGVRETLATLQQSYPLIMLTKGDNYVQQNKIDKSGLAHFFKETVIVCDKTQETFQALSCRFGVSPDMCMMVGNSLKSDIIPALEAGWHGALVPYHLVWDMDTHEGEYVHERLYVLKSISEVPALLTKH